jgi:hypothetical protein
MQLRASDHLEWCASVMRACKEELVQECGIGSECAPTVFAFDRKGAALGWAQMDVGCDSSEEQYRKLAIVAGMMRSGWHAGATVVVVEGYAWLDADSGSEVPLAAAFASGDLRAVEALALAYADENGDVIEIALPYNQKLGRIVEWELPRRRDDDYLGTLSDVGRNVFHYIEPLEWPTDYAPAVYMAEIAERMADHGFLLVCGVPGQETAWNTSSDDY